MIYLINTPLFGENKPTLSLIENIEEGYLVKASPSIQGESVWICIIKTDTGWYQGKDIAFPKIPPDFGQFERTNFNPDRFPIHLQFSQSDLILIEDNAV